MGGSSCPRELFLGLDERKAASVSGSLLKLIISLPLHHPFDDSYRRRNLDNDVGEVITDAAPLGRVKDKE